MGSPTAGARRAPAALAAAALLAAVTTGCATGPVAQPQPASPLHSQPASSAPAVTPTAPRSPAAVSPSPSHSAAAIPPVSAAARADGLIDVRTVAPDAIVDLRYATPDNFTRERLYPTGARCLVHTSMATGLQTAAARLHAQGLRLVFWDCYRPHPVQVRMFQLVPDPAWVARPGPYARSHEAGRSVDVTLASTTASCPPAAAVGGRCLLDMGTGFDDFTPRAHAFATADVSAAAQHNRALLREAMGAGGLRVYSGEWWHFDGPGAGVDRPLLTASVD